MFLPKDRQRKSLCKKREPVKAKIPPGTFVNEQAITFNDLNIGEEILLCEGSDYCRQVFDNYTKLVSKEFGEPGATLYGEPGSTGSGEHCKRLDTRQWL